MKAYRRSSIIVALVACLVLCRPANATDNVTVGVVGSASALIWLYYIAKDEALFEKENLAIDLVSVSSSADAIRQLTAGSLNFVIGGGLIDPIRAVAQGSSVAIARIEGQSPPYTLLGKRNASLKDLKSISVGGATDITKLYVERMLATVGVQSKDVDFVYAGATAPRFAALQAGAVDAAIVAPPYNFAGEAAGLANLGDVADVVKDLPFAGDQVDKRWASANPAVAKRFLSAYGNAVDWFYDEKNRQRAIAILMKNANASEGDAVRSYEFFKRIEYFEPTGKISKAKLSGLFAALKQLGVDQLPSIDQVVAPGVSQLTD
jgi:NitT/TauT family transport system substrate-binding protein